MRMTSPVTDPGTVSEPDAELEEGIGLGEMVTGPVTAPDSSAVSTETGYG